MDKPVGWQIEEDFQRMKERMKKLESLEKWYDNLTEEQKKAFEFEVTWLE